MKVYEVGVSGTVEIQAENAKEAKERAEEALGNIELGYIGVDYVHEIEDLGDQT